RFLATRPVGATVDVVGPLGKHFTPPADDRLCVLVGGGCGLAPLFGLAEYLTGLGKRCLCLLGAKNAGELPVRFREPPPRTGNNVEKGSLVVEFAELGIETIIATDDGSAGFHGTVGAALDPCYRSYLKDVPVAFYVCGPKPMMRGLSHVAEAQDMPCQVSLEGFMGCGIGVCLSCAVPHRTDQRGTVAGQEDWTYLLTCRDGPVVDGRRILWE
ncbi:MAG: hypothetical protein IMZ55_01230, partial [Acidobacteria bacterium]|nr:hypothetical protein [Acidobacteriota bacterium]